MNRRIGISRPEVMLITLVIFLTIGILLPWIHKMRGKSRRSFCESRQMIIGKGIFLKSVDSPFVPGYRELLSFGEGRNVDTNWVFAVLPYIHPSGTELAEELRQKTVGDLLTSQNLEEFANGPFAQEATRLGAEPELAVPTPTFQLPELICPDSGKQPNDTTAQPLSFVANCGMPDFNSEGDLPDQKNPEVPFGPPDHLANGVFFDQTKPDQKMNLDFLYENDGIENTLLLSENLNAGFCFDTHESSIGFVWIDSFKNGIAARDDQALLGINQRSGNPPSLRTARPSSNHPGGINVTFCDGSTKFLNENIDYIAFCHFMTSANQGVKRPGSNDPVPPPYRLPSSPDIR